jgi:transcriptional antiterminator NusG
MENTLGRARWYVVSVYSGFEDKVVEAIRDQAAKKGLSEYFEDILVAKEDVLEMKRGVKVAVEKNFFPGYILVKMILTDDTWHLVRQTARVSGFVGGKSRPLPMSQAEVDRILGQVKDSLEKPQNLIYFEVGEQVRVSEGPFATFSGLVEDVDMEKSRLKVSVSIFGRATPVDLEFTQVEKIV